MILRHSLFLSCTQDIAKLSFDTNKRTPSIKNMMAAVDDLSLVSLLLERFAIRQLPSARKRLIQRLWVPFSV
ncbi:hypothetical protein [Limnobacter sp.]|uniref:hypothetical protein n=1 Tax=Limnobacter sp. TaxID=2003368 RepID=UPI003515010A